MSRPYQVLLNDTFASIARRVYGDDQLESVLKKANPGATLEPGSTIIVVDLPGQDIFPKAQNRSSVTDAVSVLIGGQSFVHWTSLSIDMSIDSPGVVNLTAPFDPENKALRALFRPFSYESIRIFINNSLLFTGFLLPPQVSLNKERVISVTCYARPAVLNDCTVPISALPVEFNKVSLEDITKTLIEPFGLTSVFLNPPNESFSRQAIAIDEKILPFLVDLSKQAGLIFRSGADGSLEFFKPSSVGTSDIFFESGVAPVLDARVDFAPQEYYSHITGVHSGKPEKPGGTYTLKNPHLNTVRPFTFIAGDVGSGGIQEAVKVKMSRMFGNAVKYTLEIVGWRGPNGEILEPGCLVSLLAPDIMIYIETQFIISSITFRQDQQEQVASLTLVLPESYSGEVPAILPWDG